MPDATSQKCSLTSVNDKAVLLNFEGAETTSNAGLMLLSKTDQKLRLSSSLASCLKDPRDPAKTRHSLEEIIGFRATMIATGYEDGKDANKLRHDPSFKLALERAPETGAALCSQPTISRMENMANTRFLYRMGMRWSGSIAIPLNARPSIWCWISTRALMKLMATNK